MNGLTLRIIRGGGNKSKNNTIYSPVNISNYFEDAGGENELFKSFAEATSTDEQLAILKKVMEQYKASVNCEVINLLVVVFLHADAKHPVKGYISRHITKSNHLQPPFTDILASKLLLLISKVPTHYKGYVDVISKLSMCIENFNAGVAAVRLMEIELAAYLRDCLGFCVKILSENKTLSPTEKNEIFTLAHLTLRLLLHIVQKANAHSINILIPMFSSIRLYIQQLMFDDDVPMDTKSVCAILYLSMHVLENGSEFWQDILNPSNCNESLRVLLREVASELCLYSAVATVVSAERLQTHAVNGLPAITVLLHNILDIGDRCSSESTFVLGVARTVLQISKMLDKLTNKATGLSVVESVLFFTWSHLEHHMDSVRHLTAQTLGVVVKYCANLDREGDDTAITKLQMTLNSLDRSRKSYYVCVTCLVSEFGSSRVLQTWPSIIQDVLLALNSQHIQASATTTLETLLQNHAKSCSTEELHTVWIKAVLSHVENQTLDCSVLNVLENILTTAVKLDHRLMDYIIPYIRQSYDPSTNKRDFKCILMLLSVVRKSGVSVNLPDSHEDGQWKGIISYDVLEEAAIDAVDETRVLSLSLIVESPKTTEEFAAGDLSFVLHYLKYNINAQAPNFRQLTLSLMKKFIKRLEDSYKVIKRQKEPSSVDHKVKYYLRFVEDLRDQCFASLLPGANYSRRCVALQILAWTKRLSLEGYVKTWKPDYVEKLLLHLEDSYENNKALALQVLCDCPTEMLKRNTYCISIDMKDILAQASSLKPTDCVSAAYKFDLLRRRLPEYILNDELCAATDPVTYTLLRKLLSRVDDELGDCKGSVVLAARNAPMYGLLHCITHLMDAVDPASISSDEQWKSLVSDMISTCMSVNAAVASVVNNSSPEGHLPMDMSGLVVTDEGNSGGVMLDDGRQVTAQMVLLCAWRSVKEVSLLLGAISSRLTIAYEESPSGTLNCAQLVSMGAHFTALLAETKHRGAFEQAYVGFTKLLARLWRCRNSQLHSLPQSWLSELTQTIASGASKGALCATRRSAGLPFMIQALVTTELQVHGNPKCFHACMSSLMSVARSSSCLESRSHALNILRALFRNATLDESVAPYVGDGLMLALEGFEGDTWAERNSSTLLFSALMVRVFGVLRTRDLHASALNVRNKMTGRIFFLRYPHLYDFMLKKLQEVTTHKDAQLLRPSLYPVLLLLARLYPSSLEGTVSNLKLVVFIPHVLSCAGSSVLKTRQLAATAMLPLISPEHYTSHIQLMFSLLTRDMSRNYCHGILLQLSALLDSKPDHLEDQRALHGCLEQTLWILEQAVGTTPCYLITDEYLKVVNLIVWKFPNLLQEATLKRIVEYIDKLIFNIDQPKITSGRDVCLSNAIYVLFILLNKQTNIHEFILKGLKHTSYEVVLSTLNYLLILHENFEDNKCVFLEYLTLMSNKIILDTLRKQKQYLILLCDLLKNNYLECQQKSLKILTLEGDTQKYIIEAKTASISDDEIIDNLLQFVQNEHENLTHVYLESLLNFVTRKLENTSISDRVLLDVIRIIFENSSSDNNEFIRNVVVTFIEKNVRTLLDFDTSELSEVQIFEFQGMLWCTLITLLEDDEESFRRRVSDALTSRRRVTSRVPSAAAVLLLEDISRERDPVPMFVLLALVDFRSAVLTDDGNDECRVFDQNERYNIYLEETIWTNRCADQILRLHSKDRLELVSAIIENPVYKPAMDKLCGHNIATFKNIMAGEQLLRNDVINPKIELFIKKLR